MIAFPYPKYLNAVLNTDQAAAFLMLSVEAARERGIPEDRWLYWWGGAHTQEEAWWASERPSFVQCPAMIDAGTASLENAGVSIDDIDRIDFYSCFPIAVEMAAKQLGLEEDDPRGFTVTGGLPYAGGPASAYCLHSIATMADLLRESPGTKGLVTGNGWYLTKHSATVVSREPAEGALAPGGAVDVAAAPGPVKIVDEAGGAATLETYTLLYGRDGAPERGIAIGRLDDGSRFLANTPDERDVLERFAAVENVGRRGVVSSRDGHNRFEPC
jgi:acetyl-CoA C-acetyltransferase